MSFIPLNFAVIRVRRVKQETVDELGNDVFIDQESEASIKVAGWAEPAGAEPKLVGHDRRTVEIEMFAPVGEFVESDAVRLPDRTDLLEVVGKPANYEHNPFGWKPGLEVVNLAGIQ